MEKITLYSIFHGRFPSEKAHGIFAAKGAEAFAGEGLNVKLLVPNRKGVKNTNPFSFYEIEKTFSVHYLFTVDLFETLFKKFAFRISLFFFSLSTLFFILFDKEKKKFIYTNEIVPAFLLGALTSYKVIYELHDFPEKNTLFYSMAFPFIDLFITTNTWKGNELQKKFNIPKKYVFVELNAVDVTDFVINFSKEEAREKLELPQGEKMVVYTGHFYGWKGTETLFKASQILPEVHFYFIGGTKVDVEKVLKEYGDVKNVHIIGHKPHSEIPLWQKAADVLVLPNTAKKKISKYYTSPMKLFEYMASKRPIVASDLPSVKEVGGEDELYLVEPDNSGALAEKVSFVLEEKEDKTGKAFAKIQEHTWKKRAQRILSAINQIG